MATRKSATFQLTISLATQAAIDQSTRRGNYPSPDAFIEEAVREKLARVKQTRLEQLLLDGLDSGPAIPTNSAFKRDLDKKLAAASKSERASSQGAKKRGAAWPALFSSSPAHNSSPSNSPNVLTTTTPKPPNSAW